MCVRVCVRARECAQRLPSSSCSCPAQVVGASAQAVHTRLLPLPCYTASRPMKLICSPHCPTLICPISCSRLLEVARLAAGDKECAEAMVSTGLLRVVVNDVARTPRCPSTLPIAVDLLREAAGHQVPRVGFCLLECGCVEALLNLLAEGVNPAQQVDGAARVHAIETLKGLESDVEAGSHVAARLAGSTVWENCKGQRHDLFLATGGSGSLMLTGPSSLDVGNGPQRSTL